MQPAYTELHCLSNFSFLRGASLPEELIERAAILGYSGIALTDECSFAGVVRAFIAAKRHKLKLIIGSEIQLINGPKIVFLAMNRNGYGNIAELITKGRRAATKGDYHLQKADLQKGMEDCLALLIPQTIDDCLSDALWLKERFPHHCWIAVELLRGANDDGWLQDLQHISKESGVPLVAAGDVHMHQRNRKPLQDVLTAIRHQTPVARLGKKLYPNSERHLRSISRIAAIYPIELLIETLAIAERCTFVLDELRYEYPEEIVPASETPSSWLRKLTYDGLKRRYPFEIPDKVSVVAEKELSIISDLAYEPYFLTVYDVVRYAKSKQILCQGRGSAANSIICYALGITEVNPSEIDVLFERFISRERNEPPDIDVDFEHERREEVIQYVYEKYGRDRAAMTATVSTYKARGAIRDVSKALGLSFDQIDRLSNAMRWRDGWAIAETLLREAGFDPANPIISKILELSNLLIGFPRHLSQHSGGIVIARHRLSRLVPIENATMPERTVIQWDKDDLDALGLLKVDILALGMLTAIRRMFDLISHFHDQPVLTIAAIPRDDANVYDMICKADTIGVFQIESRAQMSMLPRLKPRNYYDLVIEVAIVRPGPMQGGMVHPYLRRRQGLEEVTYPSEAVKSVLSRTMGVSIFQEQVMQLAIVAAGFSPDEADQLRRAMAAWKRHGGLEPFRKRLLDGMLERGYTADYSEQLYQQILGFGSYGFPESHSASFALLVYASSWLKYYHPAAFTAALLNSQPMGFYQPAQLIQDAQRHQVEIRPVDVTTSNWDCTLEPSHHQKPALRLGLRMVSGLSSSGAKRILAARANIGFKNVHELAQQAELNQQDLTSLANADALANLAGHRRNALWASLGYIKPTALLAKAPIEAYQQSLLSPTEGENIVADYAHVGLTLRRHPLALLRPQLQKKRIITAEQLSNVMNGETAFVAGIVTSRQRPGTASGVTFITLEDETGYVNAIVWKDIAVRQRKIFLNARLLGVRGYIERQGPVIHLIAGKLIDYTALLGQLTTTSRDFR